MLKRFVLGVIVAFAASTAAKADFVIDIFDTPSPATTYTLGNSDGSVFSSGPFDLGGGLTRNITVTQVGNVTIGANGFFGTSAIDGPAFQLNTSNSAIGSATFALLDYSYAAPVNLAEGGPVLFFSFDALATPTPFTVVAGDGTNTAIQTGLVAVSNVSTTFSFPLADFAGVDLSAVTSLQIFVNRNLVTSFSAPDTDITVRDIRISQGDVPVIPAPPAVVLLLAAAPALGLVRFARRKLVA